MKLLFAFFFAGLLSVTANTYSQQTKLSMKFDDITVKQVFKQIESQSEFIVFYNEDFIDVNRKVNVDVKNQNVEYILDELFKGTNNTYKIYDRQIVILSPEMEEPPRITQENTEMVQPKKKEIVGTVNDSKGDPIPGTTVIVVGTTVGAITDSDGKFTINVPQDSKALSFSFIGFKTQEVQIGNRTTFNISLQEETVGVGEVLVVGYGTQKKATVTGAIVSINQAALLQSPVANISNSLVGRLSGILAQQQSGQPGADQTKIRIRGIGTFSGSADPLIMVDGIETSNYNNIDPNEIESISILKDASATAVYGVRGANGVLIITTKRGTVGKPVVSISSQYATSRFTNILRGMNAYDFATNFNLARAYDGYITGGYTPAYSDVAIAHYKAHDDPIFYPDVDWYPYMFDTSAGQNQTNLNINGGTENVKYFVSFGYFKQDGLIEHADLAKDFDANPTFNRYNIRSNFDFNITKRFTAAINLSTQIEKRSGLSDAALGRAMEASWAGNPVDHPDPEDVGGRFVILDGALTTINPITTVLGGGLVKDYRNYLNSSLRFNYQLDMITKGLSSHVTVSYNNFNKQTISYSKTFVQYKAKRLADNSVVYIPLTDPTPFGFSESFGKNRKTYVEAGFDYVRKFGEHDITGLLLYNQSKTFDPNLAFLVPHSYQGLVGRVTYNYKNRYLADFNVGYNGTENFAPGKRFGLFPAYSLGWVTSEEPFFPKNNYVTYLKFRGSYGVVGNDQIGGARFLYRPAAYTYTSNFYYFGEDGSNMQGYQGSLEGALGNPDLTWERAKKMNVGTEVSVFKNKIKLTFDYFNESREDILATKQTVPMIVAAALPAYNMGKMKNSGYESDVSFYNHFGKFNYWLKANFTYAHNVIQFQDEVAPTYSYQARTGQRYGQYFGFVTNGFFNSWEEVNDVNRPFYSFSNNKIQPGDVKMVDVNNDGTIDSNDQVPIGYSNFPEKVYGFSFGGDFKGFDFSVLFQGATNVSTQYSISYYDPFRDARNAPSYMNTAWSQERYDAGLPINFPRFNQGISTAGSDNQVSDLLIVDASYLRLKNVEVGYTVPEAWLKKVGISTLRIYVNGSNLLTWSGLLPGCDPEVLSASTANNEPYPVTKAMNFGFNVKF